MVSIDYSVFIQIVIFLTLLFSLNHLLYQPVMAKIAERKRILSEDKDAAGTANREHQQIQTDIQHQLQAAERKAEETYVEKMRIIESHTKETLHQTSQELKEEELHYTQEIQKSMISIRAELDTESSSLAHRMIRKLLPVMILGILIGPPGFTAEHSPGEDPGHQTTHGGGMNERARSVDFVLMVGILYVLLRKPIGGALQNRTSAIDRTLKESAENKQIADQQLQMIKTRYHTIASEISVIEKKTDMEIEEQEQNAAQEMAGKIERIRQHAQHQKKSLACAAERQIKEQVVSKALEMVQQQLSTGLDKETDRRLVDDCIRQLGLHFEKSGGIDRA